MIRNKIAIIIWLYNTELAEEFIELLLPHKKKIHIFLGLCKDKDNNSVVQKFTYYFKDTLDIEFFDNGGTDVLPTLRLLEKCQNNYSIFFKLHSKINAWGFKKHVDWKAILINDILYGDNFDYTVRQLSRKNIGIVGSKSFIMRDNEYTNQDKILELCNLLDVDYTKLRIKSFIGGNIFAAKTSIFKPLLYNTKYKDLLSKEIGVIKDDLKSTYVHSSERIFGYMAEYHNQNILGAPRHCKIILNPKIKTHRLHLVELYNKYCYIQENPNIFGRIVDTSQKDMSILWQHIEKDKLQKYRAIESNILVNHGINTSTTL